METRRSKPVKNLPETIHSLLGTKSHLTSAWVKSVCNIVKNVSSSEIASTSKEEDDSAFIQVQSIRGLLSDSFSFLDFSFFLWIFVLQFILFSSEKISCFLVRN